MYRDILIGSHLKYVKQSSFISYDIIQLSDIFKRSRPPSTALLHKTDEMQWYSILPVCFILPHFPLPYLVLQNPGF
jgi:hypothetical protein